MMIKEIKYTVYSLGLSFFKTLFYSKEYIKNMNLKQNVKPRKLNSKLCIKVFFTKPTLFSLLNLFNFKIITNLSRLKMRLLFKLKFI